MVLLLPYNLLILLYTIGHRPRQLRPTLCGTWWRARGSDDTLPRLRKVVSNKSLFSQLWIVIGLSMITPCEAFTDALTQEFQIKCACSLGFRILDLGFGILDLGFWVSLGFVLFVAALNGPVWILDLGLWILGLD